MDAVGKAGAIVGAFGFLYASQSKNPTETDAGYPPGTGIEDSLIMLGVVRAVGFFFTFLVSEPKGKSLEELTGENEEEVGETEMQSSARTVPVQS